MDHMKEDCTGPQVEQTPVHEGEDNQSPAPVTPKEWRIYDKQTRTWFDVTQKEYKEYHRWRCRIEKKEKYHGRCICPPALWWLCDGMCHDCEYHCAGDIFFALPFHRQADSARVCLFFMRLQLQPSGQRRLQSFFCGAPGHRLPRIRPAMLPRVCRPPPPIPRALRPPIPATQTMTGWLRKCIMIAADVFSWAAKTGPY